MKKTARTFTTATLRKMIALIKAKIAMYETGEKAGTAVAKRDTGPAAQ